MLQSFVIRKSTLFNIAFFKKINYYCHFDSISCGKCLIEDDFCDQTCIYGTIKHAVSLKKSLSLFTNGTPWRDWQWFLQASCRTTSIFVPRHALGWVIPILNPQQIVLVEPTRLCEMASRIYGKSIKWLCGEKAVLRCQYNFLHNSNGTLIQCKTFLSKGCSNRSWISTFNTIFSCRLFHI